MQPGEEVNALCDELEEILNEGKKPLMGGSGSNPKIVDADAIYDLLATSSPRSSTPLAAS